MGELVMMLVRERADTQVCPYNNHPSFPQAKCVGNLTDEPCQILDKPE